MKHLSVKRLWGWVLTLTAALLAAGCNTPEQEEPENNLPADGRVEAPSPYILSGSLTKDSVVIEWNEVAGATGYNYKLLKGATQVANENISDTSLTLSGLEINTAYRVQIRALAQEASQHSVWSQVIEFTTLRRNPEDLPSPDAIVAQDGSGDYTKVQDALTNIPTTASAEHPYIIYIKEGYYDEILSIGAGQDNVIVVGDGADKTILSHDGYQGNGQSVYSTLYIRGKNITVMDLTIENRHQNNTGSGDQAQAVHIHYGDRVAFYDCRITGYQDTVWGRSYETRVYAKNCYIEGNVDYIYGGSVMLFENCQLHVNRDAAAITAPSTPATAPFGITFIDCEITHDKVGFNNKEIKTIFLGRAWHNASKSVWIRCQMPAALDARGWMEDMDDDVDNANKVFAEWGCNYADSGDADLSKRLYGGRALTDDEAATYTKENIFLKATTPSAGFEEDWLPADEKPEIFVNN